MMADSEYRSTLLAPPVETIFKEEEELSFDWEAIIY